MSLSGIYDDVKEILITVIADDSDEIIEVQDVTVIGCIALCMYAIFLHTSYIFP